MSRRNNEDRLGVKNQVDPAPNDLQSTSEGFSFTTPTEFVDLPTKGKLYPSDSALHNTEAVEIRYMTAKDEDILTSKALLKKGVAVDRLLQNIIVDKSINIDELFVGDKNALLVATRITGYGTDYQTRITCPVCSSTVDYSFDLSEIKTVDIDSLDQEVSANENNNFVITLPKTEAQIEVRLLNGKDEKAMLFMNEKRKKNKLPETSLTDHFKMIIVSINEETDTNKLASFINNMPAIDSRYLRTTYANLTPNVDLNQDFACESCGLETELEIPLTTDFFWPRS